MCVSECGCVCVSWVKVLQGVYAYNSLFNKKVVKIEKYFFEPTKYYYKKYVCVYDVILEGLCDQVNIYMYIKFICSIFAMFCSVSLCS